MAANPSVEITVDFKTSSRHRYISVNPVYSNLGSDIGSGLPSFHSFTGADSTCSFFKQSKKDWLAKWLDFPMKEELNEKFRILSKCSKKYIVDDSHLLIQRFVVYVYLRKFDFIDLDELRYQVFVNSSSNDFRTIQRCPIPTSAAGILSIGMGMGEFIVAGSSSTEGVMGMEDSRGNLKFN